MSPTYTDYYYILSATSNVTTSIVENSPKVLNLSCRLGYRLHTMSHFDAMLLPKDLKCETKNELYKDDNSFNRKVLFHIL